MEKFAADRAKASGFDQEKNTRLDGEQMVFKEAERLRNLKLAKDREEEEHFKRQIEVDVKHTHTKQESASLKLLKLGGKGGVIFRMRKRNLGDSMDIADQVLSKPMARIYTQVSEIGKTRTCLYVLIHTCVRGDTIWNTNMTHCLMTVMIFNGFYLAYYIMWVGSVILPKYFSSYNVIPHIMLVLPAVLVLPSPPHPPLES